MSNVQSNIVSSRRAWIKPEVSRIEAGSAENGPQNVQPDGNAASGGFSS